MSRVTVVIVSYQTRTALARCLDACRTTLPGTRVIVIDNASADGSDGMVRTDYPDAELVPLPRNAGFAAGVNAGLRLTDSEYVLVLNPDVEPDGEATERLVDFLDEHPGAAGVSPVLVGEDDRAQEHLYRRFPSVAQLLLFWTPLRPLALRVPALRNRWMHHDLDLTRPASVDQLPGGAMLLRKTALERVGPLDPDYFIWWEDVDWAYRAHQEGLSLFVDPAARFRHEGGASFRDWPADVRAAQFYAAFFRFLCKHRLRLLRTIAAPLIRMDLAFKDAVLATARILGVRAARKAGSLAAARHAVREVLVRCRAGELPRLTAPEVSTSRPVGVATPQGPAEPRRAAPADRSVQDAPPYGPVDVVIVNWNGARYLRRTLEAVQRSSVPTRIILVDNASTDRSLEVAAGSGANVEVVALGENLGYAGGANIGLGRGTSAFALVMNPDVLLEPDHLAALRDRLVRAPHVGAAQGKLYQISAESFTTGAEPERRLLDSAGHTILRSRAVVDRGQGRSDEAAFDREGSVFSATGAALFLRRSMLETLSPDGRPFDENFFAYKEDIDLCWRARLLGWDIRFVPSAVGHHVRALPGRDRVAWRKLPSRARRHSWKNHYLMLIKNDRFRDLLAALPIILARELGRFGYALIRDPVLFAAFGDLGRALPAALAQRRRNLGAARRTQVDLRPWFRKDFVPLAADGSTGRAVEDSA